jgi:hypothetical protein
VCLALQLAAVVPEAARQGGDKGLLAWMDANEAAVQALLQQIESEGTTKAVTELLKVTTASPSCSIR